MEKVYFITRSYSTGEFEVIAVTKDSERAEELVEMFSVEEHGVIGATSMMMDSIDDPCYYDYAVTFDINGTIVEELVYDGTRMPRSRVSEYEQNELDAPITYTYSETGGVDEIERYVSIHVVASTRDEAREKAQNRFKDWLDGWKTWKEERKKYVSN